MKHFSLIPLFLLLYTGAAPLSAWDTCDSTHEIAPFSMPSTRNSALGGPHVAYTDDINSLFINPAALRTTRTVSAGELSLGIYGNTRDFIDVTKNINNMDKLVDIFSRLITESNGNIPLGFDLRGPIAFGNIKNGWGWGVFDRFYGGTQVTGKNIQAWAKVDLMFNLGYSLRIWDRGPHTLDAGIVGKVFHRVEINSGQVSLAELMTNNDVLASRLNFVPITLGTGLDLGFQYRLADNFTLGLTVTDLISLGCVMFWDRKVYSPAGGRPLPYVVPIIPSISLGASYKIIDTPSFSWAVMMDYTDFINLFYQDDYNSRNGWLNLRFGTELTLFKHVALRAGLNEMLPAVGIGLDLAAFKLNAALYGKELSNEPGGLSTYALDVGLIFHY
jgi:hypothetical protein